METIYHLRIRKDQAAAVIEALIKSEDAELLAPVSEDAELPEWHRQEVLRRLDEMDKHPERSLSWEDTEAFFQSLL